jgi:UDP-2-acetamido-2-deoxy-ribo-hexuluronate aminotransferase
MKIDFANLSRQYARYKEEINAVIERVLAHGKFIMGPEITELEEGLCTYANANYAITCSSGTDALLLAMMALGICQGDEVITTPFTFIATAETIALLGAKPVFVDIDEGTYNINPTKIEAAITEKTKAIMPVSLYGQPADLDAIRSIANRYRLSLIVDGAQSFGATYKGKAEVHYCDIYTTSFFPAKPLGCFGDGGAVLTNNATLAEKIRMLRIHGQSTRYRHKYIGLGARLDTLQAAILNVKLKYYAQDLDKRRKVAKMYHDLLRIPVSSLNKDSKREAAVLPTVKTDRTSTWAQYTICIDKRDSLKNSLQKENIPSAVHYPIPLHLQECFSGLQYNNGDFPVSESISSRVISLPMNPDLTKNEIEYICEKFREFSFDNFLSMSR